MKDGNDLNIRIIIIKNYGNNELKICLKKDQNF